jgi:predicted small lipoprotein YifL
MRLCGRPASSLALIAALVLALGVAACGRKGGLDPPPAPAGAQPAAEAEAAPQTRSISSGLAPTGARGSSSSRNLPPPPSPKRDLFIDFLLN